MFFLFTSVSFILTFVLRIIYAIRLGITAAPKIRRKSLPYVRTMTDVRHDPARYPAMLYIYLNVYELPYAIFILENITSEVAERIPLANRSHDFAMKTENMLNANRNDILLSIVRMDPIASRRFCFLKISMRALTRILPRNEINKTPPSSNPNDIVLPPSSFVIKIGSRENIIDAETPQQKYINEILTTFVSRLRFKFCKYLRIENTAHDKNEAGDTT